MPNSHLPQRAPFIMRTGKQPQRLLARLGIQRAKRSEHVCVRSHKQAFLFEKDSAREQGAARKGAEAAERGGQDGEEGV